MLGVSKRRRLTELFVAGDLPEVHFRIPNRNLPTIQRPRTFLFTIIAFLPQVSPQGNSSTGNPDCGQSQDVGLHEGLSGRCKTGARQTLRPPRRTNPDHMRLDIREWTNIASVIEKFSTTLPAVATANIRRYACHYFEDAHSCSAPISLLGARPALHPVRRLRWHRIENPRRALGSYSSDYFAVCPLPALPRMRGRAGRGHVIDK